MKKVYILITCFAMILIFTNCFRLDDFLYNEDNTIKSYKLDNYKGDVDFKLAASYDISSTYISQFTLQSRFEGKTKKIYAVYIGDKTKITTDTVILYCHGNKDHMDFYWPRAKLLANMNGPMDGTTGYGVLMIDYQGYGLSQGTPNEEALYNDVNAAMKWLKSQGLTNNRLIMYGFSMGTAPATELTANPKAMNPRILILEAPFASAEVMVQDSSVLALPGSFFTNLKIDNAKEIRKVTQPFLWLHGKKDDFLRISTHGEVVYKNYGGNSSLAIRVAGAGHSNLPEVFGFQNYLTTIENFILSN